jgi:hypothetical protein
VTDAQQFRSETETEVIPSLRSGEGLAHTRELPVVQDQTVEVRSPDEQSAEIPLAPVEPAPAEPVSAPQGQPVSAPQRQPVSAPTAHPSREPGRQVVEEPVARPVEQPVPGLVEQRVPQPNQRRRNAFLALVAALVIGVVAGVVLQGHNPFGGGSGQGGSAAAATISANVSSLDPSGGSGFRSEGGDTWRTQTYTSASFGNLKSGAGLLLDLGAPRAVSSVTFDVVGGPVAVELRAGDARAASEGGYTRITGADAASGPTTMTVKSGGEHRYWLIWVTRLAAQDGGYRAVLHDPVVKGRAS